jgi:UDP-N-acetyl-D-glucosamine/UDP-N-acetyl-D-galactosamine dehydrogenase
MMARGRKIAVVGLGYVGLPLCLALAEQWPGVIGFDVSAEKITRYRSGDDVTGDDNERALQTTSALLTSDSEDLKGADFFIVCVPTPIDASRNPDLSALRSACALVGAVMRPGAIVVFESTVYPGVTETKCVPWLEMFSGLFWKNDFAVGYSPERINPGDREHTITSIVKVVAGDSDQSLAVISQVYGKVVTAGLHQAPSIKVAEAAKVIENTQRDLNIALMNELSIIFDRLGIATKDVLDAAASKWNFLRFSPGLVGGHCIGVDPYYLTHLAESLGYHPQIILAGRRINDSMGAHVARRLVKLLANTGCTLSGAKVGVLGITFKENVRDVRNSKVPQMVEELSEFGLRVLVHDPIAYPPEVKHEYGIELVAADDLQNLDALIFAVPHSELCLGSIEEGIAKRLKRGGVVADLKHKIDQRKLRNDLVYWAL